MFKCRTPSFVFGFLLILFGIQFWQLGQQFVKGYRPFKHDPTPTYLSWDMFANPVERCLLQWDPPIDLGRHKAVSSLLDLTPKLEWGVTFNRVIDYQWALRWLCNVSLFQRHPKAKMTLTCFLPNGKEWKDERDCSAF